MEWTIAIGVVSFVFWYLYYSAECAINGAMTCGNPWVTPFVMAWEDLKFALPGGRKRKGDYIRERMGTFEDGSMCGASSSWSYSEIREGNLYEVVGQDMLPGFWHFVFTHLLLPFGPPIFVWFIQQR